MNKQTQNTLLIVGGILALGGGGYLLYNAIKGSSSTTAANYTTALANSNAAKAKLATLQNTGASSTETKAAAAAVQLANQALSKLLSSSKKPNTPATTKTAIKTTDNVTGNYIENSDPTTLYDKNGNVVGNLNDYTGYFEDANGNKIATAQGATVVSVNPDGSYIEAGDLSTLYNRDGSIKGDFDTNSGSYVDANGRLIAASDGTSIMNSDANTGAYQESDGTWYLQDGTALSDYNPYNSTYTEFGGSTFTFGGSEITPSTDATVSTDTTFDPSTFWGATGKIRSSINNFYKK